jgi:hypothetical protein
VLIKKSKSPLSDAPSHHIPHALLKERQGAQLTMHFHEHYYRVKNEEYGVGPRPFAKQGPPKHSN